MRRTILLPALFVASCLGVHAQDIQGHGEAAAVTFIKDRRNLPDERWQSELRGRPVWRQFVAQHPGWWVEFNEANGLPHRALGAPISTIGATPSERAVNFLAHDLAAFNLPMQELQVRHVSSTSKHHYVHITQRHEGLDVLFSKALVKLDMQGRVIAFGLDVYADIGTLSTPIATEAQLIAAASAGLSDITGAAMVGAERILPVPFQHAVEHHLVREVEVTTNARSMPGRWMCYVDAMTGELLYRQNRILSEGDRAEGQDAGADVTMEATVQLTNPLDAPAVAVLRNLNVTVGNQNFTTDANGYVTCYAVHRAIRTLEHGGHGLHHAILDRLFGGWSQCGVLRPRCHIAGAQCILPREQHPRPRQCRAALVHRHGFQPDHQCGPLLRRLQRVL
jgi:hypothetical protein